MKPSKATRHFADKIVKLTIASRIAKIGDLQSQRTQARAFARDVRACGMGAGETFKELLFLRARRSDRFRK